MTAADTSYMKEKPVLSLLLSMGIPMMLSMLINSLYNIVDGIFVARMSEDAMMAISLVYPVQNLLHSIAVGFGVGTNAVIAIFLGSRKGDAASSAASQGILLNLCHGLLFMVFGILFMRPFLNMFTSNETVIAYGMQYGIIDKYISFRAEGQERFTRSKTIGENYTEERIKERIAGRTPRRSQRQTTPKGISLIGDIQERIRLIDSKGYEYKAKLTILKEAARTLNYLTENNLLQYADLEKKVEDVHSSYDRIGKELKGVEARLREVQPLIKNISNYQRLKPVYDAFQKAKDKPGFKAKHEAELVIFEAARSTLLAMQGDEKLPSLKTLQAEQAQLFEEQERLYAERNRFKKEAKQIETIKSNVDTFLSPSADHDRDHRRSTQRE